MKKNISINICGTIYAIDEDAYQLLEHYLDSMKRYFSQEGDEDIADDIEHRVAELLWEQKQQGKDAVNIEMVKEIIEKIGNPADIADETTAHEEASSTSETTEETKQTTQEGTANKQNFQERVHEFASDANHAANNAFNKMKDNTKGKRLYRDSSNKMIGGVCSGLAEFFGGDPVLWRLGTALVTILFWWVIGKWWIVPDFVSMLIPVLYVCMLVVVPAAKTPEDRIRMKGGQVNPETLKEQVVNDIEASQQAPQRVNNEGSGCLRAIFGIALLCLLFPLFSAFIGLLFALLLAIPVAFGATSAVISVFPELNWLPAVFGTYSPFLILGLISGLYLVGLPIYACVRLLRNTDERMKSSTIITLIITWIVALALTVYASVFFGLKITTYLDKLYADENSREGIELANMDEWQWLDENGWTVFTLNNAENDIVWTYTHLEGISDKGLRINRDDKANPITVDMEKTDYYDDGNYVLEVIADVRGQGCTFSAIDENTDAETVATITPGQNGKDLKDISFDDFCKLPIVSEPDSISWEGIIGEENENWKYYCSEPFWHTNGDLIIRIKADNTYIDAIHIRMIRLRKID